MEYEYSFNSENRDSGSNNQPNFNLQRPIDVKFWRIKSVELPFSYYIVNSITDTLTFNDGTSRQVTVPDGNYDGSSLATALQTVLNASASALVFAVSYNSNNYKFTIEETSGPTNFIINWSSDSGLGGIMGYDTLANDTGASSYTSDNVSVLSGPNYLFVRSNFFSRQSVVDGDIKQNYACRIPVDVSSGSLITYDGRFDHPYLLRSEGGTVDLEVVEPDGTLVNFNGAPWCFSVVLY